MATKATPTGQLIMFADIQQQAEAKAAKAKSTKKPSKSSKMSTYKKQERAMLKASTECAVDAITTADAFAEAGTRQYHINYAMQCIRTMTRNTDLPLSEILTMLVESINSEGQVA